MVDLSPVKTAIHHAPPTLGAWSMVAIRPLQGAPEQVPEHCKGSLGDLYRK